MLLRKALGRLAASPLFTAFAVLSLAAGVAVTTAVYSVVDRLLFAEPAVRAPESVAVVMAPRSGAVRRASVSFEDFEALQRSQRTFRSLSASSSMFASVASTRSAEIIPVEAISARYFETVGVNAAAGRLIGGADEQANTRVAVISETYWRSRYGGDLSLSTQALRINGQPFEVVGVVAGMFSGLDVGGLGTHIWVPLSSASVLQHDALAPGFNNGLPLTVFGRLARESDVAVASAELETVSRQLDAARPLSIGGVGAPTRPRQWSARPVNDPGDEDNGMERAGMILVVLVGLVLVVACTNLANLVLARGTARQGELAVRMAMGASRGRLVWEQSIESIVLSVLGAVAAYAMFIAVSAWMTQDFTIIVPPMGRLTLSVRPEINRDALLVSIGALLLALAVFGLEPAIHLARTLDIRTALAVGATGVRPRVGRQRMIVRWQVAVAAGFFIVATMFIKATVEQARHDSGVEMDRLAVATLSVSGRDVDDQRVQRVVDRVMLEAAKQSSIEHVAASTGLPFGIQPGFQASIALPGSSLDVVRQVAAGGIAATPSLFQVLGVPIIRGRGFTNSDGVGAPRVAIISEVTAKQMFASADPIGRSLVLTAGGQRTEVSIVGVSRDTDVRVLNGPRRPLLFVPLAQRFDPNITITARSTGRVSSAVAALRNAIMAADRDVSVDLIGDARSVLSGGFEILRSAGRGALYLGSFTLLLSMVGLFGVQSHVVMYRTREFGVRMSLGATARQIQTMVIRDGGRPVFDGLVLGLWGGIAGRFIIRAYTDLNVAVLDPWMLILAPVPVVLAALCACYLPAARAARVDPTTALRCE